MKPNADADKPYIFSKAQEDWLRDLETTDAPQTTGTLHRMVPIGSVPVGYCCLGRACVALDIPEEVSRTRQIGVFMGRTGALPEGATKALRLRNSDGELAEAVEADGIAYPTLAGLNDGAEWSFKQIAAYIRANPRNVFIDEETDNAS
jgi:hypothetical protein